MKDEKTTDTAKSAQCNFADVSGQSSKDVDGTVQDKSEARDKYNMIIKDDLTKEPIENLLNLVNSSPVHIIEAFNLFLDNPDHDPLIMLDSYKRITEFTIHCDLVCCELVFQLTTALRAGKFEDVTNLLSGQKSHNDTSEVKLKDLKLCVDCKYHKIRKLHVLCTNPILVDLVHGVAQGCYHLRQPLGRCGYNAIYFESKKDSQ